MDCSKLTVGVALTDCTFATPGTAGRVILINYSDIDRSKTVVTKNVITTLALVSGAKGFEVQSLPNAPVGSDSINAGTYINSHSHSVQVRLFKKSEAAKVFVNDVTNAKIVALVENNDRGNAGDTKYEIYGFESGLHISELTAGTDMSDNVVYDLTLSSKDGATESSLPKSFFSESEQATDAAVAGLIA